MPSIYSSVQSYIYLCTPNSENTPTKDLFSVMISSSANRAAFIKSVAAFLNTYKLDGIDIDFGLLPHTLQRNAICELTINPL